MILSLCSVSRDAVQYVNRTYICAYPTWSGCASITWLCAYSHQVLCIILYTRVLYMCLLYNWRVCKATVSCQVCKYILFMRHTLLLQSIYICIYILYMAGLEYSRHMHTDKSGKPAIVSPLEPVATEVVFSAGMRRRRHPRYIYIIHAKYFSWDVCRVYIYLYIFPWHPWACMLMLD